MIDSKEMMRQFQAQDDRIKTLAECNSDYHRQVNDLCAIRLKLDRELAITNAACADYRAEVKALENKNERLERDVAWYKRIHDATFSGDAGNILSQLRTAHDRITTLEKYGYGKAD